MQHGALAKRDLYRLMATAGLHLYPPPVPVHPEFAETSCITAMEAMACGLPWVSTDRGALTETVGDAGVLVPLNGAAHAGDGDVPERLAAAALRVMHDPAHAERPRAAGLARAAGLGWGGVADQLIAAAGASRTHAAPKPCVARPIQSSDSNVSAIRLDGVRAPTAQPAPAKAAILICTPSYDGKFTSGYVASLLRTTVELPASGVQVEWLTRTGDSLLPMARNKLIALAGANPNWTHLLLVDADIDWQPGDVLRLLAHNLPFVAGLYRVKESAMVFEYIRTRGQTPDPDSGLLELDGAGAGFLLLKREVFQRLIAAYPQSRIEHGVGLFTGADDRRAMASLYDFLPLGLQDGVFMSEDYAFCRRWREIGGRIWADLNVKLTHYGAHAYTGDPMSLFRPAAELAA